MCNSFILQPNSAFWGFTDDSLSKWTMYVSMMGINFVQFMVMFECFILEQNSIGLKVLGVG
jgi:heme/copper-type cytochrome/quinol oxidase subunit 4